MGIAISKSEAAGIREVIEELSLTAERFIEDNPCKNESIIQRFVILAEVAKTYALARMSLSEEHLNHALTDAKRGFDMAIISAKLPGNLGTELTKLGTLVSNTARTGLAPKVDDARLRELAAIGDAVNQAQADLAVGNFITARNVELSQAYRRAG